MKKCKGKLSVTIHSFEEKTEKTNGLLFFQLGSQSELTAASIKVTLIQIFI